MRTSIRKLLALLLALLTLTVCLTACGGDKSEGKGKEKDKKEDSNVSDDKDNGDKKPGNKDDESEDGFWFYQEGHVKLGTPNKTLNPEDVYDNLTYTPEMFRGRYVLKGGDSAEDAFAKSATYTEHVDPDYNDGRTMMLSDLPIMLESGKHTLSHYINYIEEYTWARVYFIRRTETEDLLDYYLCAYFVEGNTLTLRLVDEFKVDVDSKNITYSFADIELSYEFSFEGRQLTLSTGTDEITLWSGMNYSGENDYINVEHYLTTGSQPMGNVDYLSLYYDGESGNRHISADGIDDDRSYACIARLEDNGLLTITIPWDESETTVTYQYVYFLCDKDGIILTDGTNTYFYTYDSIDRYKSDLNDFITEDQTCKMDELSDSQIEQITQTKEDLLKDLANAFEDEGISVTMDAATGEMAMDASILFGGDSAVLTDTGKDFIRRFVKVYTTVTANTKYADFISHTMVEGHTAPVGNSSYEDGLPLSEERAAVVKAYCLSLTEYALQDSDLEDIGYSNSKPIKDKDGKVDMAASRRVSFRFIINLDKYLK